MSPRPPGPDFSNTKATKADVAGLKKQARFSDAAHQSAYQGREPGFDEPDSVQAAYRQGLDQRSTNAAPESGTVSDRNPSLAGATPPAPAGAQTRGGSFLKTKLGADSGAGLILGMVAYALVINYLRGGLPAVKGWFGAKFLNHPYGGPLNTSSAPTPAQPAQPVPNVPVGPPIGVPPVLGSSA